MEVIKTIMNRNIVHIVAVDKFTAGYINFMKTYMTKQHHCFIVQKREYKLDLADSDNMYWITDYKELHTDYRIKRLLLESIQIIVSGLFESRTAVSLFEKELLQKTYIHFWGADFYDLRKKKTSIKEKIKRMMLRRCFKKCGGLVFLIDGEYERFVGITHIHNRHFVAPMPRNPSIKVNYTDYRTKKQEILKPINILVGNSATSTNRHIEVFNMLRSFSNDEMRIFVPLSYGDSEYRKFVLKTGFDILGQAFHPILDFMNQNDYTKFLATIDIGIFHNDRQQAMGNITALLGLGAKLFLRDNTSMWKKYINDGYIIFPTRIINSITFDEFMYFDSKSRKNNENVFDKNNSYEKAIESWNNVFSDKV